MAAVRNAKEIGAEGLNAFYGHVSEPYLSKLEWPNVYGIYDEMRRRDPTLRSLLNAVKLLARKADWQAQPATQKDEATGEEVPATDDDKQAADYLNECMDDMSHTVEDFIDDVLTFLPFGWSSFEICYKRRDDGMIGWRKLAFRRQSSLNRWEFEDDGAMAGWHQLAAPDYKDVFLPIEKLLHFVGERDGQNPEGLALFESAYEPWHYVKNLQIISGIGWQRSFVGLPVFKYTEKPTAEDNAAVKAMGQALKIDDRAYVSLPPGVDMSLETTANTNATALIETIKFYRTLMLQMVLADFIMLGSGSTGSWSLGQDKSELFLMAINGYLDKIAAVWNRFGVARLFEYYPGVERLTDLPTLTHTDVHKPSWGELGTFVSQIANYITLTDQDELWIRQLAGMPETMPPREEEEEAPPLFGDGEAAPEDLDVPDEQDETQDQEPAPGEVGASEFFRSWSEYG